MLFRRGLLFFAAFSWLWAQSPIIVKGDIASRRRAASGKAPVSTKRPAQAKPAAAKVEEPAPKIDPTIHKVLKSVADRYRSLESGEISASMDAGRQVEEEARQSMAKADVKFRWAPKGLYSLEVIEEADDKPPYQVVSDGSKRWAYVPELKQYRETSAFPSSKPLSAVEADASGPLAGTESYAERLIRQVLLRLSNIDQSTDNAFVRGNVLTLLGKPDANGKGVLMYVTVANEQGDVSKVSWYQSDGPDGTRMLVRTDFVFSSQKELKPAPQASEFSFTPPPGAAVSNGASVSGASSEHQN